MKKGTAKKKSLKKGTAKKSVVLVDLVGTDRLMIVVSLVQHSKKLQYFSITSLFFF
jgi:hypothetical protein